ncbi:uncharacterized protein MELLADRAFT_70362 [Melampsora larici-populina 98AG31]|uniref:Uncharacterized protein n=1 Tax=Melampsora larici-populina (strain 98AG31 / pathotype 3-4-7) TaxID=747676 RepID=F4SEP2_MELLP|nr:uncharacterized protein MELLADRAFT_70362 [Melampsora larici-populina 98AG31]EGF96884.1 hypothetical protein MELLADRAFT_70362 [Melampsora larici-populina 98AG31]
MPGPTRPGGSIFASSSGLTMAPPVTSPSIFDSLSPVTSPFKEPSKSNHHLNALYTPEMASSSGLSRSASQSSLVSNPHINPKIFDTPLSSQNTPGGSPATVSSVLPTDLQAHLTSSKKRPASVSDVDRDLPEDGHL